MLGGHYVLGVFPGASASLESQTFSSSDYDHCDLPADHESHYAFGYSVV